MTKMTNIRTLTLFLVATAGATACGASQGTNPEDMSAQEHRAMADHEQELVAEHGDQAQHSPTSGGALATNEPGSPFIYGVDTYDPASRHRANASHHEELAQEHEAAAQALETFEQAQCSQFPPATRAACPLLGSVASVEDVDGGVVITLAEGVNRDAVVAHIRCHLAFAATAGREGMANCPLYLPGVSVAEGDAPNTIVLTIEDANQLDALRERTRAHILE